MNSIRSVARFASSRSLPFVDNHKLVRSQSCCYFSMSNRKAARATWSKSTFIAEYQKELLLYSVSSKAYSQGPKDGNLEKETRKEEHSDTAELKLIK